MNDKSHYIENENILNIDNSKNIQINNGDILNQEKNEIQRI
jgi:hypothetical protein